MLQNCISSLKKLLLRDFRQRASAELSSSYQEALFHHHGVEETRTVPLQTSFPALVTMKKPANSNVLQGIDPKVMRDDMATILKSEAPNPPRLTSLHQRQSTKQIVVRLPTADDRKQSSDMFHKEASSAYIDKVEIPSTTYFVVLWSVDVSNPQRVQEEMGYTYGTLDNKIKSAKVICRHKKIDRDGTPKDTGCGYVELNLSTAQLPQQLLRQGTIRCDNQLRRVEAINPMQSVLRRFKCHKYGHKAQDD